MGWFDEANFVLPDATLGKDEDIDEAFKLIAKTFVLRPSKCECGSTSSPRTTSFYCALAITSIKNAKPLLKKMYKLTDEKGMFLPVSPNSTKYFRLDYRYNSQRIHSASGYLSPNDYERQMTVKQPIRVSEKI